MIMKSLKYRRRGGPPPILAGRGELTMVCRKCSTVTTRKTHDGPKAGKTMWYAWYFHCLSCGWLYMPDEAKRTLKLLRSATTAPRVGAAQKVPCQKPTAAIPVEELAAHMRINPNKLRQYLAAPLPAVDDDVEVITPADCQVDLDALEAEYPRFIAGMPADEVEIDAVEEEATAAPLPAGDAKYQRFIAKTAALPPIPPRTTIWLSDTLQVPIEGAWLTSEQEDAGDDHVPDPPLPRHPERVVRSEERRVGK